MTQTRQGEIGKIETNFQNRSERWNKNKNFNSPRRTDKKNYAGRPARYKNI